MKFPIRYATVLFVAAGFALTWLAAASVALAEPASSELTSRIQQNQVDISRNRAEIAVLDLRIDSERKAQDQNRTELADATARELDAEDQYNATLKLYEGRISAIYKLGEGQMFAMLLDSNDLSSTMARLQYLSTISENDRKLVLRVKADAQKVREMHDRVDYLKQSKAGEIRLLTDRKAALLDQIQTGQAQVDADTAEIAKAQARERDDETRRLAQEAANSSTEFSMPEGPLVFTGSNQPPAGAGPTGIILSGVSSWYGPGFNGNRTANGETYNMYAFTAAHKTLPFGTWLKVTYKGRSVFVRINDRGPYVGSRILDLSFAGAQAIGLNGIGYVTCEIYR